MPRNIIITEKQAREITDKAFPVKKVNAGIMDAVTGGDACIAEDKCDYEIGFENNSPLEYAHVIGSAEPSPIEETTSPSDVNLSSFNVNDSLNPKIWKDGRLDSRIRLRLLDIADKFIDGLEVDIDPIDIIMTGSLANFNWDEEHSDIDLHVIVDFTDYNEEVDFLKDYFDSKKKLWNDEHEGINIFGFPVELYVQDVNENHTASGVYSIEKDRWVVRPSKDSLSVGDLDEDYVKKAVADYMNIIDELQDRLENYTDKADVEDIYKCACKWFKRIKTERKQSLDDNGGEYSNGNIIFKSLRRNEYIEKLLNIKRHAFDIYYSLP